MSVLYVRLDDGLSEEIKEIAATAGLSTRLLVEAILSDQVGRRHQLSASVKEILHAYRGQK